MAAITKRLLHPRPNHHHLYPLHHFSSSDSDSNSPSRPQQDPPNPNQSTFSSYFKDVKSSLQNQPPPSPPHQSPRRPLSFSNRTSPQTPPPSTAASLEEIRRNLADFRLRSAPPPPSSIISVEELYKRNVDPKSDGSPADAIRESLRQLKSTNRNDSTGKPIDLMSLSRLKETLKMKGDSNANPNSGMFFGKETNRNVDDRTELVRMYNHQDLGKKLKMLRPEKKKGQWFSLEELNERLVKLREIEEKESEAMTGNRDITKDLREGLLKLSQSKDDKARKATCDSCRDFMFWVSQVEPQALCCHLQTKSWLRSIFILTICHLRRN